VTILRRPTDSAAAGDPIPFSRDGATHLFYLSSPLGTLDYPERVQTTWQHAWTSDFRGWKSLVPALAPREADAYDAGGIWTGSVIESDRTYYLFYTGHHVGAANPQVICLATSTDLVHFERHGQNPLITPIAGYEAVDWRDPYVFYNEAERRWWMLIAARLDHGPKWRRGCIVLATSENLIDWDVEPDPLYVPGTTYCPECPEMWTAGGRWYLVFSRFSEDVGTIYRVADSPRGPIRVPVDDALGGRRWYAAKSAPQADGSRVFFGWVHDFVTEGRPRWLWGGDFAAPRVVTPDAHGELSVRLHPGIEAMFDDGTVTATKLEAIGGEAHATAIHILPETCLIRAEFAVADNPAAFGLALAENDDLEGWFLTFDRNRSSATLAREPRPLDDFWADLTGRSAADRNVDGPIVAEAPYSPESGSNVLSVLLDDEILEIYVDTRRALTHRIARTTPLRAVAFVVDGCAEVNVRVSKPC
jgi:beta-fructofuranosidase